jgi:hypothetical protein
MASPRVPLARWYTLTGPVPESSGTISSPPGPVACLACYGADLKFLLHNGSLGIPVSQVQTGREHDPGAQIPAIAKRCLVASSRGTAATSDRGRHSGQGASGRSRGLRSWSPRRKKAEPRPRIGLLTCVGRPDGSFRQELRSGQVDSRLLLTLGEVASQWPVSIVAFGDP